MDHDEDHVTAAIEQLYADCQRFDDPLVNRLDSGLSLCLPER